MCYFRRHFRRYFGRYFGVGCALGSPDPHSPPGSGGPELGLSERVKVTLLSVISSLLSAISEVCARSAKGSIRGLPLEETLHSIALRESPRRLFSALGALSA